MSPRSSVRSSRRALLGYVAAWALAGAAIAALAVVLLGAGDGGDGGEEVSLPPLEQTELMSAARVAGCELRRDDGRGRLRPPADGPAGTPARAGIYERPPRPAALVGAIRRGIIVIHYRARIGDDRRAELRELQRAVPTGTIVTPNEDMPYLVAVVTWRRLLGCRTVSDVTTDAVQLFRGRYLGSGPDR